MIVLDFIYKYFEEDFISHFRGLNTSILIPEPKNILKKNRKKIQIFYSE